MDRRIAPFSGDIAGACSNLLAKLGPGQCPSRSASGGTISGHPRSASIARRSYQGISTTTAPLSGYLPIRVDIPQLARSLTADRLGIQYSSAAEHGQA